MQQMGKGGALPTAELCKNTMGPAPAIGMSDVWRQNRFQQGVSKPIEVNGKGQQKRDR